MFQRDTTQPGEENGMSDEENSQRSEKNILIHACQEHPGRQAKIAGIQKDRCSNGSVPNALNDQNKYAGNGIFIHRRQIRDRRLQSEGGAK